MSIMEAMVSALPVIATAVGGVPEAVEDGVAGLLVPAHDPEALAHALVSVARDRPLREAMGAATTNALSGSTSERRWTSSSVPTHHWPHRRYPRRPTTLPTLTMVA